MEPITIWAAATILYVLPALVTIILSSALFEDSRRLMYLWMLAALIPVVNVPICLGIIFMTAAELNEDVTGKLEDK